MAEHEPGVRDIPSILLTNAAILLSWFFFRAADIGETWSLLAGILTVRAGTVRTADLAMVALFTLLMVGGDILQRRRARLPVPAHGREVPALLYGVGVGVVTSAIVVFSGGVPTPFIYFQF